MHSLEQVEVKWQFIRQRLLSYNENTVPYLVDRYTDQMVGILKDAITAASD